MTIKINKTIIYVESVFQEVYFRLKQFEINSIITDNKILIYDDCINIHVKDYDFVIKEKINTTDLYPIINNLIAYLINDDNNLYIHSVLISKNNNGVLILGDFKSGKSLVANCLLNYGFELNSADQTWIKKNKLVLGSSYNKNKEITFIKKENFKKKITIKKIYILKGLTFDNDLFCEKIINNNYYIKNIFKFANWHYDMPLLTKYIKLNDSGEKIINFLKNNKMDTYIICGDVNKIVEEIYDREKYS